MTGSRGARLLVSALIASGTALVLLVGTAHADLPPEGRCPDWSSGSAEGGDGQDRGVPVVEPGMEVGLNDLMALRSLFPEVIWDHREAFFYEGMRMEIGACHRRYPPAGFYSEATERFGDRAKLDEKGNLAGYIAGVPFPPESIDPTAPDAGVRWAWNFQHRYRGSGPVGKFRLFDLPGRIGKAQTYIGDFFYIRTGNRADLAATDYRMPEATKTVWVAGGSFDEPFSARHLAWRQMRSRETMENWKEPDDTFVYVPTMRKPRRAASSWVDGIFTPRYRVSGDDGGGPIPFAFGVQVDSGAGGAGIGSIQPTAGLSIAATEDIRRGFSGLAIRPNAYDWTFKGEQEVLAPLNGTTQGWPQFDEQNYGPTGVSPASDRWDVRWAVALEGKARKNVDNVASVDLWIDYQTLQPLYFITRKKNGFIIDIGILVHRYSADQPGYPAYPGGESANVFDPVAAHFYFVPGGGSGWRRESYDVKSLPIDPGKLRKMTSSDELMKGH